LIHEGGEKSAEEKELSKNPASHPSQKKVLQGRGGKKPDYGERKGGGEGGRASNDRRF